jgi:hypothetical protein
VSREAGRKAAVHDGGEEAVLGDADKARRAIQSESVVAGEEAADLPVSSRHDGARGQDHHADALPISTAGSLRAVDSCATPLSLRGGWGGFLRFRIELQLRIEPQLAGGHSPMIGRVA